ncbi:proline racemase [Enhydrobacter aerosaccus]|uniref:4-hydroxyproline epimerase n=1 Tax=Enhydrobacter aerosaccus TaxID=225324 RepID=A0A1T4R3S8_9HYPH|nr:proline racemase family protein [Enhydrobacter aerosaccus]SKA10495.1 proline racemase [Enhydrobacter aerosaccus]
MILSTVEMHTGGEPTRIIVDGWPRFEARTLLDKRREARERFDGLRRGLMLEPRGHDGMYGALLVEPDHPEADLAVLFMHNEGYSTMCGHATIALARWAVESGRVKRQAGETIVRLQCPCGLVVARVAADGFVRFESVPSFVHARERIAPTRTWGPVSVDIAYGGAFYAFLPADSIGLDLQQTPMRTLVDAGEEIADAVARSIPVDHPEQPELGFLYGTILTDGRDGSNGIASRNVCIFAGRQIDRSPTGSGVSARMALQWARRQAKRGEERLFESCTGACFTGRVLGEVPVGVCKAVVVEVGGRAHFIGESRFRFDAEDPLREGFSLGL